MIFVWLLLVMMIVKWFARVLFFTLVRFLLFWMSILICSFFNEDYGLLWFLSKIKNLPPSKIPVFNSAGDIVDFFKTFVLREVAIRKALEFKLDGESFFARRFEVEKNKVLYDFYLKFLVNSVDVDSSNVKQYFLMNRDKKYIDPFIRTTERAAYGAFLYKGKNS